MNIISCVVLAILYIIDPLIWYKSMSGLGLKFDKKKGVYFSAILIYYLMIYIKQLGLDLFNFQQFSTFIDIILHLFIVSSSLLLFKGDLMKKILSIGGFYCAIFLSESICILFGLVLLKIPLEVFLAVGITGILWSFISKILMAAICWLVFYRGKRSWINFLYGNKEIVVILLVNMTYEIPLGILILKTELHNNPAFISLFCLFQIILIISVYYLWRVLKKRNQMLYELKCELEVAKQNAGAYTVLRQLKHDIAGHVNILFDLCKRKKYAMLEEYMEGMYGSIKQVEEVFDLADPAFSILMGQLKQKALNNKCRFRFFDTLTDYCMSSYEICTLVSNLINNAIENTCKLPEENRSVSIDLLYIDGGYCIEVCNNAPLGTKSSDFNKTSKSDKENHGIGMSIIRKISDKHKGVIITEIIKGEELGNPYDIVSITTSMQFKEIAKIQREHRQDKNVNT